MSESKDLINTTSEPHDLVELIMNILLTGNTSFKIANFREGLIRRLLSKGHHVTIGAPPDDYVEKIRALGCDYYPLHMDRNGTALIAESRLFHSIYAYLRRARPDVVFSYTIKNNIYAGIACRTLGIPFAPNITGLGPAFNASGLLNRVVRTLYRIALRGAHSVFFQNTEDLRLFLESGLVAQDRVKLLPGSGVDLNHFVATPLPDCAEEIRFILVARLLWDKGVSIYIDAARKVREAFPQARFQLLGPLDQDSKSGISQAQIDEWVAEGAIEYLGATQNVLPFLQAAHCVVLPSYYREGTPRSLLEAGAVGRPIITTDMPGCRDVVIDRKTGYLIAPRNVERLVSACVSILSLSSQEREEMGRGSRAHIVQNYDEEIVIDAYIKILDELSSHK